VRHLVTPFPSIAAGAGPFLVRDSPEEFGGRCAPPDRNAAGLFQSPFSVSSPLALAIRAHEYGHLGLSRQKLQPSLRCLRGFYRRGIHNLWSQGTLDVVVNHFMMARGNRDIGGLTLWQYGLYPALPRWIAAILYIRAEGLRYASLMRMSLLARTVDFTGDDLALLNQTSERLALLGTQSLPLSPRQFLLLLRRLQSRFGPDSRDAEHPMVRIAMCVGFCDEDAIHAGFPSDWPDLEDYVVRAGMSIPRSARRNEMGGDTANIPWGPMEILAPPLIHSCRKMRGMAERKLVCGYTGAFRFPSRALLPAADGRAFTLRRPRLSHCGTLLIDCSGSMSEQVTDDRLMAVLAGSPSATIGLYAGGPTNESGSLLIVARNGMRAAREVVDHWPHSGNVVDGPALQWLSKQKAPRVWVSDGGVTGLKDRSAMNLIVEAAMLLATADIRRIATLDDYLEENKKEMQRLGQMGSTRRRGLRIMNAFSAGNEVG